jgi:hypothetical protein
LKALASQLVSHYKLQFYLGYFMSSTVKEAAVFVAGEKLGITIELRDQ